MYNLYYNYTVLNYCRNCTYVCHNTLVYYYYIISYSLFYVLKETGLSLPAQLHGVACCGSGVILTQILLYWNKYKTHTEKEACVEKRKAE